MLKHAGQAAFFISGCDILAHKRDYNKVKIISRHWKLYDDKLI